MADDNNKRAKKVSKIFAEAQKSLEAVDAQGDIDLVPSTDGYKLEEVTPVGDDGLVFMMDELKATFIEARSNLRTLLSQGQHLMGQTASLSLADMSASQIEAIAALSNTVNMQVKTMIDLYKMVVDVETKRRPKVPKTPDIGPVGDNANITNNTIFVGDTAQLMEHLKPK